MNIKFNKDAIISMLKRGAFLGLTLSVTATFTACSSQDSSIEDVLISDTVEDVKPKGIYDFNFLEHQDETVINKDLVYDWTDIKKSLEDNYNFKDLILGDEKHSPYGLALFYNDLDKMSCYYKIIDHEGNYIKDGSNTNVALCSAKSERLTILKNMDDLTSDRKSQYFVFDHLTGNIIVKEAFFLINEGDFLVESIYSNGHIAHKLLYSDGTLACDKEYLNITYDEKTDNLFLVSQPEYTHEKITEIVNVNAEKAICIDGAVTDACNNYLIIQKNIDANEKWGVVYLESFDAPLIDKIDVKYDSINFLDRNLDVPSVKYSVLVGNKYKYYFDSADGKYTSRSYDLICKGDADEYYEAYNNFNSANQTISLLKEDGEEVLRDVKAEAIKHIKGTETVIYKVNVDGEDRFGLMGFDKKIIARPEYDNLIIFYCSLDEPDTFRIVGSKHINDICIRSVYDEELNLIAEGPAHMIDFYDIAYNDFGEYVIEQQNTEEINNVKQKIISIK